MTRAKVLYVDSEEENLVAFRDGFGAQYAVSTSTSGVELLQAGEFAVVIGDRAELLGEARRRQPDAVTMMVTANPSFENAVEAINQGRVVRYLRKPWKSVEMLQALDIGVELFEKRRENRLLRDRLIAEERQVVIGQLASGLVHELANIGAVLAVIENVREDWGKGIPLDEELETLRLGVDKYWALVGSLRFCGDGKDEVHLTPVPHEVAEVMKEAFELAAHFPAVRRLAKFELDPSCDQRALVDRTALFHALLNILKNAAEACPPTGGAVQLRARAADGWLRIEVQDNGHGIPPEIAHKIMDGFYSTKGASGTGLGLLVTRRIIHAHGGKLEFLNRPEGGCVFSVCLKPAPAEAEA